MKTKKLYFIKSYKKFKYNKNFRIYIIKCFIIIFSFYSIKSIFLNIIFLNHTIILFISYIKTQMQIKNIEKLILLYKNSNSKKIKKFKKCNIPKISVISPIYNSEKYILRFLRSIQNQNFLEIEIILVDDCSNDNSVFLIEKYIKEDERIILIKNKINKGTFITRNLGVLFSKSKYIN